MALLLSPAAAGCPSSWLIPTRGSATLHPGLYAIACFAGWFVFQRNFKRHPGNLDESSFLQVTNTHSSLYYVHLIKSGTQASGQLLRVVISPKVHEKQVRGLDEHV